MSDKKEKTKSVVLDESTEGLKGVITLNENVVATIAGLAARQVKGVHSLGKSRMIGLGSSPARGVAAEVGVHQAAFDLDIVIDYGVDIRKVAEEMRQKIAEQVLMMAGREVVEVNIHVVDIKLPEVEKTSKEVVEPAEPPAPEPLPRVK
jgi:uncharacterized alkaline shock family protein YloU